MPLNLSIGVGIGSCAGEISMGIPLNGNERVIAKGSTMPTVNNYSGLNRTRIEGRGLVLLGGQPAKSIRLVFWNGYITIGEKSGSNALTIGCAIENLTGGAGNVTKVGKFGASTYKRLNAGEYAVSEPFYPADFGLSEFPANWEARWRTDCTFDVQGHLIPYPASPSQSISGIYSCASNSSTSQLANTGALVTPSASSPIFGKTDSSTDAGRLQPVAIIGEWVSTADISVAIFGDSIQERYNDTAVDDGTVGGAMSVRGLRSVSGRSVPWVKMAKQSERATYWSGSSNSFRKLLMGFCTHMIDNTGTNDINASISPATTLTSLQLIWSDFKANAKGAKRIIRLPLLPLTSSTDSWATTANQTPAANYGAGGNRDTLNSTIAAAIGTGGYPDELVNINSVLEVSNKWVVNGTANYATDDGTHPTPAGHALAGALITTAAASWTP